MSEYKLVVPLRIEGKHFESDTQVSQPFADFSKLPWNNGTTDINFTNPYVSDSIIRQPFDRDFTLKRGLHLHFILPHFLGKQVPVNSNLNRTGKLPAAPNRWLVSKEFNGTVFQWLIQSDYVYSAGHQPQEPTTVIPATEGHPFRYMGRKIALLKDHMDNFSIPEKNDFKSLNQPNRHPLTAVGYGDINFSSFYPNCMSVFGFHDPKPLPEKVATKTITYTVMGWYSDLKDDIVHDFFKKNTHTTEDELQTMLDRLFNLSVAKGNQSESIPGDTKTLFFGKLLVNVKNNIIQVPYSGKPALNLAIGNTGTEALSALLANQLVEQGIEKPTQDLPGNPKTIIEEQLESILMLSKLDHHMVDTGAKFLEARHDKGFRSSHAGHLWKINTEDASTIPSNQKEAFPALPAKLANALDKLNKAQVAYDKARHEIKTLQEQLYADWYKYMQARYPSYEGRGMYPDPDQIQYYIRHHFFNEIQQLIISTGQVNYNDSYNMKPRAVSSHETDLAHQIVATWNVLDKLLEKTNKERKAHQQPTLSLSMIAGPRFWEANAPVILFSGLKAKATIEGSITCHLIHSSVLLTDSQINYQSADTLIDELANQLSADTINTLQSAFEKQQWNPFILDWMVDLTNTNLRSDAGGFNNAGLKNSFDIHPFRPDFKKHNYQEGSLNVFSGSVLMSSHARQGMLKNIEAFFRNTFKKENIQYKKNKSFSDFLPKPEILKTGSFTWKSAMDDLAVNDADQAQSDFISAFSVGNISNPYFTAWQAYLHLSTSDEIITQTLDGFNHACIMKKKVPQIRIAEPIGFEYAKKFTEEIKLLVQSQNTSSPIIDFAFNPIRCGELKLNMLSLIDNFGESHPVDLTITRTTVSETLTLNNQQKGIFLKPRLAQPARLNFRWQSANTVSGVGDSIAMDSNSHPDTSPVCGWLMANYLDQTIAVFDASGSALGYINPPGPDDVTGKATWNTLPWSNHAPDIQTNILNKHLQKMVSLLCNTINTKGNTSFLSDFLTTTQVALDRISPANAHIHNVKSILMGRPMAVVRASLSFELKGKPALDQSWSSMLIDIQHCDKQPTWTHDHRNRENWTDMLLPCRLGEHAQLNDGLVGYWKENKDGTLNHTFIAPETTTTEITDSNIDAFSGSNFQTQWISLNDNPLNLTLLVDPRGLVHATTGLLPTKAISIPTEHYIPAMQKIKMWFKTISILQPLSRTDQKIELNLPPISGYNWQWWDTYEGNKSITKVNNNGLPDTTSKIMEGWLSLTPAKSNKN